MSTATAEAPVETKTAESVKTEAVKADVKVETSPPAKSELITSLLRPNVQVKDPKTGAVVAETGKKTEIKPTDSAASTEVKTEIKGETKTQEQHFHDLRKAREADAAALKERDAELAKLREEHEILKKSVPADWTEKLSAAEKREQEAQKKAQELQEHLVAVDLKFDPEIQQMQRIIETSVRELAGYIIESGVPFAEVNAAIREWDEDQLYVWKENLSPGKKQLFDVAFSEAVRTDRDYQKKLANPKMTMEEIGKRRMAEQEKQTQDYFEGLRREKGVILTELESAQEIVKNDPALRAELETLIDRAARLNGEPMPPAQILRHLANAHVLARHFQRVENEKGVLAEKLAGVEKTLAERDAFIAKLSGSSPVPGSGTGTAASVDDKKALVNKLIRPTVSVG